MSTLPVVVLSLLLSGAAVAQQDERTIRLATLEWPPYTTQKMAHGGETTSTVRAALAAVGYRLEVEFLPWKRALALTKRPSRFDGYFPEYVADTVAQRCMLSEPIGRGPVGFAQLREQPIEWKTLGDLAQYRVGVVQEYVNSAEFDLRIAQGRQQIDLARDDTQNLRKLAAGRVALAVVDHRVFDYLMQHDPQLQQYRNKLELNSRLLEIKQLHICFRPTAKGKQLRDLINAGLRKLQGGTHTIVRVTLASE